MYANFHSEGWRLEVFKKLSIVIMSRTMVKKSLISFDLMHSGQRDLKSVLIINYRSLG